ncbi:DEAD/DEAH box helicase [uncultured Hyphomonas sp.]|uniref:DEAD/DEAH box helicase n=1 Tax=uncultured Hyphomonas sp. TaxID=225298 RepID=UPI002AAC2749|nr:DEAD/DEAH box helicase [uncultured Hyphomonas sp.]
MTKFSDLGLNPLLMKAISEEGYETPTPIQAQAIPLLLEDKDLLGIAQTGTGKTAAFALPTLDFMLEFPQKRRARSARVLVLAPTRELAGQIAESFRTYSRHMDCNVQTVFGGVNINAQRRALQGGTDVLVATPGRLLDLVGQKAVTLQDIEVLILDEADQMLDMGFIHDLKKIVAQVPKDRQTLLFSATMPKTISDLAQQFLDKPVRVSVTPPSTTAERVDQGVYHVANGDKLELLFDVLNNPEIDRALVFTRTKHGADKVVRKMLAKGLEAKAIHGNKSQPQRLKALDAFKNGNCKILVATDIAARGIDIDGISHVVNFEVPNVPEQYVHRIGRTARAGRTGLAVSFVAEDERYYLRDIEKTIDMQVDVLTAPEGSKVDLLPTPDPNERLYKPKGPSRGNSGGGRGNGGRGGQRRLQGKAKPQNASGGGNNGAGKSGGKQGGRNRGGKKRKLEGARG